MLDIDGPVQAEVFVVWLNDGSLELSGPCGAGPWLIELGAGDHPVDVVGRIVRDEIGEPLLLHSTSWRRDRDAVILSFIVVADERLVRSFESRPVERVDLARSGATAAPAAIAHQQVLEHAVRHLAWLAREDPIARSVLTPDWQVALARYVPEPFQNLG